MLAAPALCAAGDFNLNSWLSLFRCCVYTEANRSRDRRLTQLSSLDSGQHACGLLSDCQVNPNRVACSNDQRAAKHAKPRALNHACTNSSSSCCALHCPYAKCASATCMQVLALYTVHEFNLHARLAKQWCTHCSNWYSINRAQTPSCASAGARAELAAR